MYFSLLILLKIWDFVKKQLLKKKPEKIKHFKNSEKFYYSQFFYLILSNTHTKTTASKPSSTATTTPYIPTQISTSATSKPSTSAITTTVTTAVQGKIHLKKITSKALISITESFVKMYLNKYPE